MGIHKYVHTRIFIILMLIEAKKRENHCYELNGVSSLQKVCWSCNSQYLDCDLTWKQGPYKRGEPVRNRSIHK